MDADNVQWTGFPISLEWIMLRFFESDRLASRRAFLEVGATGMAGLALPQLLSAATDDPWSLLKGKSVIFVFQHGGPSQYESYDPKMTAPSGVRSMTGEIPTSLPGITFGGTMDRLAPLADRMTIVRSYRSGSSAHKIQPIVSADSLNANIGSLMARVVGTNNPQTGMPSNVAVFPNAVDDEEPGPFNQFGVFASSGPFSKGYSPFVPGGGGELQKNMQLSIDRTRLGDRKQLLSGLDRIRRNVDATGVLEGTDRFQQQAFDVVLGGVANAFDLAGENPQTVERYDTAHLTRFEEWKDKNNKNHYKANSQSLGKLLLLARRLCESGCNFVTVTTSFVWDMHADVNNLGMVRGMNYVGSPFNHSVSALIEDIEARGLQDDILVVCTGEMGRTPKINDRGGRDHWGNITPLLLYGAGIPRGRVIGQSTSDGGSPQSTPVTSPNLISTIMHTLVDVPQLRLRVDVPRELMSVIGDHRPIHGLDIG